MYAYAHHLAGKTYKIGYQSCVLTSPPTIKITALNPKKEYTDGDPYPISHYLVRKFQRGATSEGVLDTIRNPVVALHQWGGKRTVFVTPEMTVVMDSEGTLVTVWGVDDYDDGMRQLLADAGH